MDDLTHIFVTCSKISWLFQRTQSSTRKLIRTIDKIPVWWYIIGLDVNVRRLGNLIFAQAEIAILYIVDSPKTGAVTHCVVTLLKAKVISRVNRK